MNANENQNKKFAEKLNYLLDLGADVNARDIRRQTPLYVTHASVAKQLIKART